MGFFNAPKAELGPGAPEGERPQGAQPSPQKVAGTLIAQGVTVKGTVEGEGIVQVEGVVEGEFRMEGAVVVAATGLVRGPITADVVRVAGKVEGNVTAREHVRLEQTGALIGDVATASLVVEDGGCLNGRSTMTEGPAPAQEVSPAEDLQFGPDYALEGQE